MIVIAAVDFFNHLNMLYGTVTEFCTPEQVSTHALPVLAIWMTCIIVSDYVCWSSVSFRGCSALDYDN
jgi:Mob1/phocein family